MVQQKNTMSLFMNINQIVQDRKVPCYHLVFGGRVTLTRDALPSAAASLETSIGGNSQLIQCVHCAGTFPAIPDQDLQLKETVAANLN